MAGRDIDLRRLRRASGIEVGWCESPKCGPHVILLDEEDRPFAHFALSDQRTLRKFIRTMQNAAYDMATRRR